MSSRQFLIVGGDIAGNLGDSAIALALTEAIKRIHREARIAIVANQLRVHGPDVPDLYVAPGPRGMKGLFATAAASDAVICGGGGLFQDDDSLVKMPYWAFRLLTIRPFARRIIGFSIGAGPLRHPLSRFSARIATALLDTVSVRDRLAKEALQSSCSQTVDVIPDPAFMLTAASGQAADKALGAAGIPLDGRPLIGVAVRRYFNAAGGMIPHQLRTRLGFTPRGRSRMAELRARIIGALEAVIAKTGAHVVFLPTYHSPVENDTQICKEFADLLPQGSASILEASDPRLYKAIMGRLRALLAGRMHPAILAAGMGTPSVGLAYNQKFRGTFELMRQKRVIDVAEVAEQDCADQLARLLVQAMYQDDGTRQELKRRTNELAERTRQHLARVLNSQPPPEPAELANRLGQ